MYADPVSYSSRNSIDQTLALNAINHFRYEWPQTCRILDAGCAVGNVTKNILSQLSPNISEVVGFDVSEDMIRFANTHNSERARPTLFFQTADLNDKSSIPKSWLGSFDKVFSLSVLHFVPNQPLALNILSSCLKPHGEAIIYFAYSWSNLNEASRFFQNSLKWRPYLKNFTTSLITIEGVGTRGQNDWASAEDPVLEYKKLMQENGFCGVDVEAFSSHNETRNAEGTVEFLSAFLPQLNFIPPELHHEFVTEFREIMYPSDDPLSRDADGNFLLLSYNKCIIARGRKA